MCISLKYSYTNRKLIKNQKVNIDIILHSVVDLIQILPIKKMSLLAIEISITLHLVAMSLFCLFQMTNFIAFVFHDIDI